MSKEKSMTTNDVGERLSRAGRLELRTLCVCATEKPPTGLDRVSDIITTGHHCLGKASLLVAAGVSEGYVIDRDEPKGICGGALGWLGLVEFGPEVINEIGTGPDAMFLKQSPQCAAQTLKAIGKTRFPGAHLVVQATEKAADMQALSYLCFGGAEQVRNLCGLLHFGSNSPFGQIDAAWGSFCASFIAFPSGMAEGAPKESAFLGPTAPDGNPWFPMDLMAIAFPARVALRMAGQVDESFVAHCVETSYPEKRDPIVAAALQTRREAGRVPPA
jgi:hypothetical protein